MTAAELSLIAAAVPTTTVLVGDVCTTSVVATVPQCSQAVPGSIAVATVRTLSCFHECGACMCAHVHCVHCFQGNAGEPTLGPCPLLALGKLRKICLCATTIEAILEDHRRLAVPACPGSQGLSETPLPLGWSNAAL